MGLHYLLMSHLWDARFKWVKEALVDGTLPILRRVTPHGKYTLHRAHQPAHMHSLTRCFVVRLRSPIVPLLSIERSAKINQSVRMGKMF